MCIAHFRQNRIMEQKRTYGENFREIREDLKMTQTQVAKALGVHQSSVSDWENDVSQPDFDKLKALARMYDVSLDELLMFGPFAQPNQSPK